ncbi:MAG: pseudouridine synthase [Rhodothermales bacterium]
MPSILYQTEHLVVVDKPAGMLVHRTARDKDETTFLVQTVRDMTGRHVYPVHRLDKPTSGTLILAFDPETTADLSRLLAERRLHRTYVALVRGWVHEPVRIDYPLTRVSVRDGGPADAPRREAITNVEPVTLYDIKVPAGRYDSARYTYLKLYPETGRTHQLRRHLKHVNHPIIGDRKYGDRDHNALWASPGLSGLMLHAQSVTLPDGTTVEAPLPERFVRALEWLSGGNQSEPKGALGAPP